MMIGILQFITHAAVIAGVGAGIPHVFAVWLLKESTSRRGERTGG